MSDVRVPVKTWLRGPTYVKLDQVAKRRGFADVGSLLEQMAEHALKPSKRQRKARVVMTTAMVERLWEMKAAGSKQIDIARELGVSPPTVSTYIRYGGWQR